MCLMLCSITTYHTSRYPTALVYPPCTLSWPVRTLPYLTAVAVFCSLDGVLTEFLLSLALLVCACVGSYWAQGVNTGVGLEREHQIWYASVPLCNNRLLLECIGSSSTIIILQVLMSLVSVVQRDVLVLLWALGLPARRSAPLPPATWISVCQLLQVCLLLRPVYTYVCCPQGDDHYSSHQDLERYNGVIASTTENKGDTTGVTLCEVKELTTPGAPVKSQLFITSTNIVGCGYFLSLVIQNRNR